MQPWQFSFFGGVEATCANVHLSGLMGKKAGAVLALLALSPGRARPREEIIDLVWPEVDYEEARDRFKQQLTFLRKQLEPHGVAPGSVLVTNRSQAGLADGHQSDVAQFQDQLRRAALATEPERRAQFLREALALYKGEFAPGFYQDFLLAERERLAALADEAKKRLAILENRPTSASVSGGEPAVLPIPAVIQRTVHTENRFFGREAERKQLPRLLQENRLVTLLGPGGTGKTRLLEELQSSPLTDAPLIFLSTWKSGGAIADAIVAALELPNSNEPALHRLTGAFAGKNTLLMLDNMEQLMASGGAEAVAELLQAIPTLRLLVTSRIKLSLPQECVFVLAPLPQSEAEALFVNRARLARANFAATGENADAIRELCRRLDGLPLALELAAARAAILSPSQILERLTRRFDLLTDRRRDREERHTSLRATLDWGWALLAPDVQTFFAQICVFRGSFSLEAAEAVTNEPLALDYLHYLADSSFLIVEGGEKNVRFRLLETLRDYGREKCDEATSQTLPVRHGAFFLAQAKQWSKQLEGVGFADAMRLFRQDHDNFGAALDAALDDDPLRALELCRQLADFWQYAYLKREALHYLTQTLHAVQRPEMAEKLTNHQWASLHGSLANAYQNLQEYPRAHQHFREAVAFHDKQVQATEGEERKTAQRLRAGALHNLANNLFYENRFAEAHDYYAEAAALNREIHNDLWLANNLNGLCHICGRQAFAAQTPAERTRLFTQGLFYANEAVDICRAASQEYFLCFMLVVQSDILLGLERFNDALPVVAEGFALAYRLENWEVVAEFLIQYHHLAFQKEQWDEAAQLIGAVTGMGERWKIDVGTGTSHLTITDARRTALSDVLGAEIYHQCCQTGFQVGLHMDGDVLRRIVSTR